MQECPDAELVARSLEGDRDAFSRIVSRYQILICSLAYNRLGNLGQSEDVAQETFITAWKHLRLLREPEKLRSWLCGIVRNRLHKHVQREFREPASHGDSLEIADETPAAEALPNEQAIGREEEAILWRSLERMPEIYREPLILFYRENQSIGEVAADLELSEDTVKQRLSRGRKLLQEEVQVFVERTLRRSAPSQNFSAAVLAALPAMPVATAATTSVGAAGKGAAVAKTGLFGAWLAVLAPFIGVFAGLLSQWVAIRATSTGRVRKVRMIQMTAFFILILALAVFGESAAGYARQHFAWSDAKYYLVRTGFWWCFAAMLGAWVVWQLRKMQMVYQYSEAHGLPRPGTMNLTPAAHACMTAGTYISMFAWLISVAYRAGDPSTAAIVAALMIGMGAWNFLSVRRSNGMVLTRIMTTQMAIYGIVVLLIFNLRLDVWMATARGTNLAEVHTLFPQWIVPSLSLALVLWIGLVWTITSPKVEASEQIKI